MTQSHLPRTGRGVVEAVEVVAPAADRFMPAFSREDAGFLFCEFSHPAHFGDVFRQRYLTGTDSRITRDEVNYENVSHIYCASAQRTAGCHG